MSTDPQPAVEMTVPQSLAVQFEFNHFVLKTNTDGVTDGEAVAQPPSGGNCMNWVVGHVVATRNLLLQALGKPTFWGAARMERYGRGSGPVTSREDAVPMSEMLADLDASQDAVLGALSSVTAEQLLQPAPFSPVNNPDETIGTLLSGLAFHEAYHAGQTGILRHVCGKPGAIA